MAPRRRESEDSFYILPSTPSRRRSSRLHNSNLGSTGLVKAPKKTGPATDSLTGTQTRLRRRVSVAEPVAGASTTPRNAASSGGITAKKNLFNFPEVTSNEGDGDGHFEEGSNFVLEPILDKPIEKVWGVGVKAAKALRAQGFDQASVLLGQFLLLQRDRNLFEEWFQDITKTKSKGTNFHARRCSECLQQFTDTFIC